MFALYNSSHISLVYNVMYGSKNFMPSRRGILLNQLFIIQLYPFHCWICLLCLFCSLLSVRKRLCLYNFAINIFLSFIYSSIKIIITASVAFGSGNLRTEAVSTASIQVVNYGSPAACSGPIQSATTYSADICLPIGIPTGNSSIFTKSGSQVTAQGYKDKACTTTSFPLTLTLDTCSSVNGDYIKLQAYPPNTIPPSPFTSTTGQVTATFV